MGQAIIIKDLNFQDSSLGQVSFVQKDINIDKVFYGSKTEVINTGLKLFSDECANWEIHALLEPSYDGIEGEIKTAFTCMDESGSPYNGFVVTKQRNQNFYALLINGTNISYDFSEKADKIELYLRRRENFIEYSLDGKEYISSSIDGIMQGSTIIRSRNFIVGGYESNDGVLGRAFKGRMSLNLTINLYK